MERSEQRTWGDYESKDHFIKLSSEENLSSRKEMELFTQLTKETLDES